MEAYKTYRLEKQREMAKKPTFDLIEKPIEKLQGCSSESHVTDLVYSQYEQSVQQQIWKIDLWKVILSHQGKSTITSKRIYDILLHAKMESCLKFSRSHVFDDRLKDNEMRYHHERV